MLFYYVKLIELRVKCQVVLVKAKTNDK